MNNVAAVTNHIYHHCGHHNISIEQFLAGQVGPRFLKSEIPELNQYHDVDLGNCLRIIKRRLINNNNNEWIICGKWELFYKYNTIITIHTIINIISSYNHPPRLYKYKSNCTIAESNVSDERYSVH